VKTGIIGLGAMGAGMAANFHKAGLLHRVWNRTPARAEEVRAQTGVEIAPSVESLAGECDLIVTCVSRDADLLEVVNRVAAGIGKDAIVADTSTVGTDTARAATAILSKRGAHFLDCPVSGGTEGAKQGTLAMMVGGEEAVLERARPALSTIAKTIVRIGPTGSGQACKAVNQLMIAGIYESVAEALAFGESMGLDMERVIDVISGGAAANWVLAHRGRSMLAQSFPPGFKVALHHKDLEICRRIAESTDGAWLPVAERMLANYRLLMDEGYGDEDVSAVYRLKYRDHEGR
jgi:3-hydroxyisobutyrate dehydrogenase